MALVVSTSTAILTLAEVRAETNNAGTDTQVQRYIDAATALVEDYCGPVVPRTVTQTVTGHGVTILEGRVVSVDSVLLDGVAVTGYTVNLPAGLLYDAPRGAVVTYTVGFDVIPDAIKQAALLTVQHAIESQAGAVPTTYGATDETFVIARGFALPNAAKEYLAPYRRGPAIA